LWTIAGCLQYLQLLERAVIGAIEAGFIAHQERQTTAFVGHFLEGPGQAVGIYDFGELFFHFLVAAQHFIGEQRGLDGAEAAKAPTGGGQGLRQFPLDASGGFELIHIGTEKKFEAFAGFGRENHGFGGESVAQAVAGGAGATFRGGRAAGLGAIGFGAVGTGRFGFWGTGSGNDFKSGRHGASGERISGGMRRGEARGEEVAGYSEVGIA
jgi:hypothetical protein